MADFLVILIEKLQEPLSLKWVEEGEDPYSLSVSLDDGFVMDMLECPRVVDSHFHLDQLLKRSKQPSLISFASILCGSRVLTPTWLRALWPITVFLGHGPLQLK